MLKFLPLFLSNLRRKPLRTGLTLACIVVASLLFGLLKTLQGALELGADLAGVDRLVTMHRMTLIQLFPRSYLNRIDAVDGVTSAVSFNWLGGTFQDERNQVAAQATDPDRFFQVYPEYTLPDEQKADWIADRGSIIVGKAVAARYGWKVGDTVPIRSSFYRRTDGGNSWDFRIAGIYDARNGDNSSLYFHWNYLNQSTGEPNQIGYVVLRVSDPAQLREVARQIDAQFANSPAETKTDTERAFIQGFANQMGDIGAIVTAVVSAVFFTILLVAGNTMAQSVRERTNELAVLKTLGFPSGAIAGMVLAEALVITALGGAIGLGLATLSAQAMSASLQQFFPVIGVPSDAYVTGAILVVVLAGLAALLPSIEAGRLKITEALRKA
jgi:putative ABC transport system permease protein